jgi:replication factor A1
MSEVPDIEGVIKAIVLQVGLSREEINKKIDATIAAFNGLLTKIGAALVVADKLNVKIGFSNGTGTTVDKSDEMKIKDLVDGMKNVVAIGRVFKIHPSKSFTKKDGHDGKVASVLIQDATGKARVSFWDRKTEIVAGLKEGDIIGVYNASVKSGFNGGIDINVGDRTNVKINPDNVDKSTFAASNAATGSGSTKRSVINDITESTRFCSFKGTITEKFEPREFQKKDGIGF